MAIELEKGSLNINQIIAQKSVTDTVDSDCIVPDVKPDILEIVGTSGVINIYKKELSNGKIRVDGSIQAYIMYYGEEDKRRSVRSIKHTLDFSEIIQLDGAKSEMMESTTVTLQSIDCKIINERKISIKARVNYNVKVFSNSNEEYVNNVKLPDIQKMEKSLSVKSVIGSAETKTSVNEKVSIDPSDDLAEILKVSTSFSSTETKISYNKVLTKADLNLKMIYLTEDGRVGIIKKSFPIMGFVDMKDIRDDSFCDSELEIRNMVLNPSSNREDHSVSVNFEIGIKVTAYQSKTINVIEDLYSPSRNLAFKQKSITAISSKSEYRATFNFSEKQTIGITNERVIDIQSNVIPNSIRNEDGSIAISGNVDFAIMLTNEESTSIKIKNISIPFVYKMAAKDVTPKSGVSLKQYVINENYNILPGGEIDFKVDIVFIASTTNITNIRLIDSIEESKEDNKRRANMVIYFTKEGDTLWNIAKNFRSTVNNIKEVNNMEDGKIQSGMQLFIIS